MPYGSPLVPQPSLVLHGRDQLVADRSSLRHQSGAVGNYADLKKAYCSLKVRTAP
jgi:hypothetical protein